MPESTIIVNDISAIKEKPGALPWDSRKGVRRAATEETTLWNAKVDWMPLSWVGHEPAATREEKSWHKSCMFGCQVDKGRTCDS